MGKDAQGVPYHVKFLGIAGGVCRHERIASTARRNNPGRKGGRGVWLRCQKPLGRDSKGSRPTIPKKSFGDRLCMSWDPLSNPWPNHDTVQWPNVAGTA